MGTIGVGDDRLSAMRAAVEEWHLLAASPQTWDAVLSLARARVVDCPLRPPHSLMAVFTLAANLGAPCAVDTPDLFDRETGARAVEMLGELVAWLDDSCYAKDPIDVLEAMAAQDGHIALSPLVYGYVSYARPGFRARQISQARAASRWSAASVSSTAKARR